MQIYINIMQASSENITLSIETPYFNFKKQTKYKFFNNSLINDDFCNYLKYLSNKNFLAMNYLMDKAFKKERIFFRDQDYVFFNDIGR